MFFWLWNNTEGCSIHINARDSVFKAALCSLSQHSLPSLTWWWAQWTFGHMNMEQNLTKGCPACCRRTSRHPVDTVQSAIKETLRMIFTAKNAVVFHILLKRCLLYVGWRLWLGLRRRSLLSRWTLSWCHRTCVYHWSYHCWFLDDVLCERRVQYSCDTERTKEHFTVTDLLRKQMLHVSPVYEDRQETHQRLCLKGILNVNLK